jgi:hypothetical protein
MGKNRNIARWVRHNKKPLGHSHPLNIRSRGCKYFHNDGNTKELRILVFIKELIFGRTVKGEKYPERVYFKTTYPDVKIKEDQWNEMLAVSARYLVEYNKSRKQINFKRKLIKRNGRHKKSK